MTRSALATKERPAAEAVEPMRLTVNRTELLRALGHASAIVEKRNTIPVLSNVLLEAAGETLRIIATDLNLQIALTVPCRVEAEGATTVNAALIYGIVREFDDGAQVELKLDENRLQVVSGRSRYKLQTISRKDFPVVEPKDALASFALPAADVLGAFGQVAYAQDTDAIVRPHYCGVNVETSGGKAVFVATDGKRIAWSEVEAPAGAEVAQAILPTKLVSALSRLLDGREGDVRLTFEDRKIIADLGTAVLTGKLVDGTYPPWRRVIPQGKGKKMLIGTASFAAAVRRVALIASERTRAVKIELATDKLTVSCASPGQDVAVEEVPCVWGEEPMELGFNSKFLLDTLAASGADELQVDFHQGASPLALFTDPNDASASWLLAPMYV